MKALVAKQDYYDSLTRFIISTKRPSVFVRVWMIWELERWGDAFHARKSLAYTIFWDQDQVTFTEKNLSI